MSLKAFHIFFIIISVLTAFGFGAWIFLQEDGIHIAYGVSSVIVGVLLIVYGVKVFRKFREMPT